MAVKMNSKATSIRYSVVRMCRPTVKIVFGNGLYVYNYQGDCNENDRTNIKSVFCNNW
jgi:hypothetical protein